MNTAYSRFAVEIDTINEKATEDPKKMVARGEEAYATQVEQIVDDIIARGARIILVAGPSSAGKTTSSHKIKEGLIKKGKVAVVMEMDDFFFNDEMVPFNELGERDIENLCALDVDCVKKCLEEILANNKTMFPQFDFKTHSRKEEWVPCDLGEDGILVMEGIHALNPIFTEGFEDPSKVYRVYVHCNTNFCYKDVPYLPARMLRLIRRVIRDERDRGVPVIETIERWNAICKGEDKNIRPYKGLADYRLNSSHFYEPGLYKEEMLENLKNAKKNGLANEICERLQPFVVVSEKLIPKDSLVREFIGKDEK